MKKTILLSNGLKVKYNSETNEGYEDVLSFYEPKLYTLVNNWISIPYHDKDDLVQICRIKLLEALKTYNPKKKINFSTYVYTVWNRKIFQISSKYKSKKYSAFIENDTYVNLNHKYDKLSTGQFLENYKDKCPLNKNNITDNMCSKCSYHVRYEKKIIKKGKNMGLKKNFTLCKYYKEIMKKRGELNKSLDSINGEKTNLLSFIACNKQKKLHENEDFRIEFNNLKKHLHSSHFMILQFIVEGFNKSEIIKKMETTNLKLTKTLEKISKNKKVKELLLEK